MNIDYSYSYFNPTISKNILSLLNRRILQKIKETTDYMKKLTIILLAFLSIMLVSSCFFDNDNDEEQLTFFWAQTKCAEPWSNDADLSDLQIQQEVVAYLDGLDIAVYDIWMNSDDAFAQACEACVCTTGIKIYVRVDKINRQEMEDLGFQMD